MSNNWNSNKKAPFLEPVNAKLAGLLPCLVTFVMFIHACITPEKPSVNIEVDQPIEFTFDSSWLRNNCLSPFEPEKIWVEEMNGYIPGIVELDFKGNRKRLADSIASLINIYDTDSETAQLRKRYVDEYDSLIWLACPGRNVALYDQKTKLIKALPIQQVLDVVVRPKAVYFYCESDIYYWYRKEKTVRRVVKTPGEFDLKTKTIIDPGCFIDLEYSYKFNSGDIVYSDFLLYLRNKRNRTIISKNNIELYRDNNSIWYNYRGEKKQVPFRKSYAHNTFVFGNRIWQFNEDVSYVFDPENNQLEEYKYRLPTVNSSSFRFYVDKKHLWIYNPGLVMLIDLIDKKQFEFRNSQAIGFQKLVFDDHNLYILYRHKLTLYTKEAFKNQCTEFDPKQYDSKLANFEHVVDSIGLKKDSATSVVLEKLKYLKDEYAWLDHPDIKRQLQILDITAFESVNFSFPNGLVECYRDSALPLTKRINCLHTLVDQYGKGSNFRKAAGLNKEYIKYFGKEARDDDYYFRSVVDSCLVYVKVIDSLDRLGLAEDSLCYYKAMELSTICTSRWYSTESCAGYIYTIMYDALKEFMSKFPNSKLCDNAEFTLTLGYDFFYEEYDAEDMNIRINEYEKFLRKYPDSDTRAEIYFEIFLGLSYSYEPDVNKVRKAAKQFISEFVNDKCVPYVRERLLELNITL